VKPTTSSDGNGSSNQQYTSTTGQTVPQNELTSSESCSLCGDSEVGSSRRVNLYGNDISCGEFGGIILSEKIWEGSEQCLNIRADYFGKCCDTKPITNQQYTPTTGQATSQGQTIPSEACSLCGNSGQLNWSEIVNFDSNDISCGELFSTFLSENILEGSDRCLNFRAQYSGECCDTNLAGDGCDLCETGADVPWHDIQEDVNVDFDGDKISCANLSNMITTRFEPSSAECIDIKDEYFYGCCIEKCSLCGDLSLDWDASVFFSGEEILCHELDSKIFVGGGINADSLQCEQSQRLYAGTCCIQAPKNPCHLCNSNGVNFNTKSNIRVSYAGEVKTCLDMYHSLSARREQSSEHCIDAQGELFGQCCESIDSQTIPDDSSDGASPSPTMTPTTQKPNPEFNNWYAGGLLSSSASSIMVSFRPFCLLFTVGLMVIC